MKDKITIGEGQSVSVSNHHKNISIRSELKDLMLNAQTGEITWIPQKEDLGLREITVNVSDGFSAETTGKKTRIRRTKYHNPNDKIQMTRGKKTRLKRKNKNAE